MSDTMKEYIAEAEKDLLHTYNRFPVVLDRGEGVYLYDCDGKQYLDFAAGIAVFALGYHNPDFDNAVKAQADKLVHTSNLFYNEPAAETAEKLNRLTGMDRVFFTNSGTEAIEGAIKLARKYAYNKDGCTDHEIIAMNHSFHGRSMGALSVTGKAAYQDPFKPLIGGVKFAEYNDLDSVKDLVTDKTCAVILETFGIGGIPDYGDYRRAIFGWVDSGRTLVVTTQVPEEGCDLGVYEVGRAYAGHRGILKGGDMTTEALVAKTMWALGQTSDPDEIRDLFYRTVNHDRLAEEG